MNRIEFQQRWDLLGKEKNHDDVYQKKKKKSSLRMKIISVFKAPYYQIAVFGIQKTYTRSYWSKAGLVLLVKEKHHWLLSHDNRLFCTRFPQYWCEWCLDLMGWCNLLHISCHKWFIESNVWWPFNKPKWYYELASKVLRFTTVGLFSMGCL